MAAALACLLLALGCHWRGVTAFADEAAASTASADTSTPGSATGSLPGDPDRTVRGHERQDQFGRHRLDADLGGPGADDDDPGLALFYGGMVRKKNVLSTLMQSFAITALVTVLWWFIGYSLAFTPATASSAAPRACSCTGRFRWLIPRPRPSRTWRRRSRKSCIRCFS